MTSLKVVSLNIEFDRHLDLVLPFLKKESADIYLINELLEPDIPLFEEALGMKCFFKPQVKFPVERGYLPLGEGVFSKYSTLFDAIQYAGPVGDIQNFAKDTPEEQIRTQKYMLITATFVKEATEFQIGLTHFLWTPNGEADDLQRQSVKDLLAVVERKGEMALFGDFNAPRGKEIFSVIEGKMKDNVPSEYKTSLDGDLHRVGKEQFFARNMHTYVVDGCFTTPEYKITDIRLEFGVSDHAAVIATVVKTAPEA